MIQSNNLGGVRQHECWLCCDVPPKFHKEALIENLSGIFFLGDKAHQVSTNSGHLAFKRDPSTNILSTV